ncbi:MAG: DEAD/DEAH box helicase [Mariprofundaceae bacterium]|nr:DEAD/DEAH box helicase [Mariprofundaceae bacterium]
MTFDKLGLSPELLRAVSDQGYTTPTPVQAQSIPVILEGHDIMAGAQTGTGKTAGFTLPMLEILNREHAERGEQSSNRGGRRHIRVLVLTPTRELAAQVNESIVTYGKYLSLRSTVVFGGVGIQPQINKLNHGVDILVATPGRLLDLVNQRKCDLSKVEMLVLDEADRMLDMGFIHDIRKVLALIPKNRQTLLFSATFSSDIKRLASGILKSPRLIEVSRNETAHQVTQVVHPVGKSRKREMLSYLIQTGEWKQVLVFTRTKHGANKLTKQLVIDGIQAAAIHGNKSQTARTNALKDFKKGAIRVLVATDIAARGLDIDQLPHVVNFELPNVSEDYVHRIGRTGRAGRSGEAMSLVCNEEVKHLRGIEKLIGKKIHQVDVPGFEADISVHVEPVKQAGRVQQNRRGGQGRSQHRSGQRNAQQSGGNSGGGNRRRSSRPGRRERAASQG